MLKISQGLLEKIKMLGEKAYPEEGVGFLFGTEADPRQVLTIYPVANAREKEARHNRYTVAPQDIIQADEEAEKMGFSIIGVFHSHPEHPSKPSEFDLKWAAPYFSYIITSVQKGKATESRSWRLNEERKGFVEERIDILPLDTESNLKRQK